MKRKIRNFAFYTWLFTLLVFACLTIWLIKLNNAQPLTDIVVGIWLVDIALGIIAFLIMLVAMTNSRNRLSKEINKEEKIIEKAITKQRPSFWMILSLLLLTALLYVLGNNTAFISDFQTSLSPTSTTVPTFAPSASPTQKKVQNTVTKVNNGSQIECIGPDGKHFQTTMDNCKNLNEKWGKPVDYMINCNIHPDCGGGTVYISKSQCDKPCSGLQRNSNSKITVPSYTNTYVDNSITCFVSYPCTGNSYTYRLLPTDCINAQNQAAKLCSQSNNSNNYIPVATPTLTESEAQALIDQYNSQIDACRYDVSRQYEPLISGCSIQYGSSSATEVCVRTYEAQRQYAYDACGTKY